MQKQQEIEEITFMPTLKQARALYYLFDKNTTEILFGGAASGGKSYLGCAWITYMCFNYPGTRWLIGRSVLKTLRETTLKTLFDLFRSWKLKPEQHYTYNISDSVIKFYNSSEIILKDLEYTPSDPDFDSLGSLEISGAFIDEASQITQKCKDVVSSRIRYKLRENDMIGKLLMTCNPTKNWIYTQFYKPYKDKALPKHKRFISALLQDNPHMDPSYKERLLQSKDNKLIKRLLYGDWEYDNDETALISYDDILESMIESYSLIETKASQRYISADIARFGNDKTVIMVWEGFTILEIVTMPISSMKECVDKIEEMIVKYKVLKRNIVIDENGIGGGVLDFIKGAQGFMSNARPLNNENYVNLKTQCAYRLSKSFKEKKISMVVRDMELKEIIIQELENLKADNIDKDAKLAIVSKDQIKKAIGRSPDYLDAMIMRMYFDLKKVGGFAYSIK